MIDLQNGRVKITEGLWICSGYTFKEFKKSKFYKSQDSSRVIFLDEEFVLDNRKYKVSLHFEEEKIYLLSLMCCDIEFTWEEEKCRKELHDEILRNLNISNYSKYDWGEIVSDFDPKGCRSSINIIYF